LIRIDSGLPASFPAFLRGRSVPPDVVCLSKNMQLSTKWRLVLAGLGAVICIAGAETSAAGSIAPVPNRPPLQMNAFNPLPLGAVRPRGWLMRQEQIQAAGLSGHL